MNYQNFLKPSQLKKQELPKKEKDLNQESKSKKPIYQTFLARLKQSQQNQIILAQREGTKLDALQTFFTRLQTFEDTLKEQIERQKADLTKRWF